MSAVHAVVASVNSSGGGGGAGQVASDTFESYSADASLAAQPNWDAVTGAMIVKDVSGNKFATGNSSILNSACIWVGAGTFNESQYSEGVIRWSGGTGYIAVIVNAGVGVETWYAALVLPNSSQVRLDKVVGGSLTVLTTVSQGLSTGNSIKLIRTGSGSATRLTVQVDTGSGYTDIITNHDPGSTYISGGSPGILSYDNLLTASLASWAGGNN